MPIKKKPDKFRKKIDLASKKIAENINTAIAPSIPKPIMRVLEFAGVRDNDDLQAKYLQVAGYGRPMDDLLASNLWEVDIISEMLIGDLERLATKTSLQMALQIQRVSVTPGSKAVIDTSAARKICRRYANADGVDSIAAIRLCPIPDDDDPNGFAIATYTGTLIFGADARNSIGRVKEKGISIGPRRSRRRGRTTILNDPEWFDPNEQGAIRRAVERIMKPCFVDFR